MVCVFHLLAWPQLKIQEAAEESVFCLCVCGGSPRSHHGVQRSHQNNTKVTPKVTPRRIKVTPWRTPWGTLRTVVRVFWMCIMHAAMSVWVKCTSDKEICL